MEKNKISEIIDIILEVNDKPYIYDEFRAKMAELHSFMGIVSGTDFRLEPTAAKLNNIMRMRQSIEKTFTERMETFKMSMINKSEELVINSLKEIKMAFVYADDKETLKLKILNYLKKNDVYTHISNDLETYLMTAFYGIEIKRRMELKNAIEESSHDARRQVHHLNSENRTKYLKIISKNLHTTTLESKRAPTGLVDVRASVINVIDTNFIELGIGNAMMYMSASKYKEAFTQPAFMILLILIFILIIVFIFTSDWKKYLILILIAIIVGYLMFSFSHYNQMTRILRKYFQTL